MNTSLSASECHCQPFNDKTNINKLQMSRILGTLPSHAQIASKNAKQPRLSHVYQHKTWSWKWPASQYEAVHTLANTSSCHLYKSECCIWFHPAPRCWYIGTKNCSFKASAWVLEPPKERASFANRLSKSVFSKTPKTFLQIRPCVFFGKGPTFLLDWICVNFPCSKYGNICVSLCVFFDEALECVNRFSSDHLGPTNSQKCRGQWCNSTNLKKSESESGHPVQNLRSESGSTDFPTPNVLPLESSDFWPPEFFSRRFHPRSIFRCPGLLGLTKTRPD